MPAAFSKPRFDRLRLSVEGQLKPGQLGRFSFMIGAGAFLNREKVYLIDTAHFNATQLLVAPGKLSCFLLLPYYSHSTVNRYVEAHAAYHPAGFLLNRIGFIRKLSLMPVVNGH